ncbi:MAG: hypothetical protein EA367_04675 [Leptolyngbya sp. DLM2.Bin15]|nr:MAG: hypothetical protein EA367_04675 [Leptolyngbya sp. DLM2.Bin15]
MNLNHIWLSTTAIATLSVGAIALPAYGDVFDNTGIQFDVDTIVEFRFEGSDAAYRSTFGILNLETGVKTPLFYEVDAPGSSSRAVPVEDGRQLPPPVNEFSFQANVPYIFYLESTYNGQPAGTVYSLDERNPNGERLVRFTGGLAGLAGGGTLMEWEDTGALLVPPSQQDRDFNDFIVRAGGHLGCPLSDQAATSEGQTSMAIACAHDAVPE